MMASDTQQMSSPKLLRPEARDHCASTSWISSSRMGSGGLLTFFAAASAVERATNSETVMPGPFIEEDRSSRTVLVSGERGRAKRRSHSR